jgi:hypothetical protein
MYKPSSCTRSTHVELREINSLLIRSDVLCGVMLEYISNIQRNLCILTLVFWYSVVPASTSNLAERYAVNCFNGLIDFCCPANLSRWRRRLAYDRPEVRIEHVCKETTYLSYENFASAIRSWKFFLSVTISRIFNISSSVHSRARSTSPRALLFLTLMKGKIDLSYRSALPSFKGMKMVWRDSGSEVIF